MDHGRLHIPVAQSGGHGEGGIQAVHDRRARAQGDECVHTGSQDFHGLKAIDKVPTAHEYDGHREQKLRDGNDHHILHTGEKARQRQTEHPAHADIH